MQAEYFLMKHKPTIDISPMTFSVGRAALLKKPQDVLKLSRYMHLSSLLQVNSVAFCNP